MKHRTLINIQPGSEWDNDGTLQIPKDQALTIRSPADPAMNVGTIYVAGCLNMDADFYQGGMGGNASVDIINGGKVILGGSSDGGVIGIQSGMLEFSKSPTFQQPDFGGSYSAINFRSKLSFAGSDGVVKFDGISSIQATYRPDLNDISVVSNHREVADLHLANGFNPYSAAEFTTKGNELTFHFIRV